MPDESVSQQLSAKATVDKLDQRILRALEDVPEPHISADFAARVVRQLPNRRPVSLTPTHYGRNAMLIGMIVTLLALLALTLHNGSRVAFSLPQSLLLTQFIALIVWLSIRRHQLN